MSENEIVFSGGTDLVRKSELYEPMLYYGAKPRIQIEYVSDIHLLHHVRYYDGNLQKTIVAMAKSLYQSRTVFVGTALRVFLGDVSSDQNVTVAFYRQYRMQDMYSQYKRFKNKLLSADDVQEFKRKQKEYKKRSDRLKQYIAKKEAMVKQLKAEINEHVSYSKVIAPKGNSESIRKYLDSRYYKERNLPGFVTEKILQIVSLYDEITVLQKSERKINAELEWGRPESTLKLTDFHYEQRDVLGLVILGNHEYSTIT